jgi:hypothetical protein
MTLLSSPARTAIAGGHDACHATPFIVRLAGRDGRPRPASEAGGEGFAAGFFFREMFA